MNEYVVLVAPTVERLFHVTAETRARAVELVAEHEEEGDGEKVLHVRDKERGYEGRGFLGDRRGREGGRKESVRCQRNPTRPRAWSTT